MDKFMKSKKVLELDTSLSLSCKTCLEKLFFWSDPLNLETVERKGKKGAKYSISQEQKGLFRGNEINTD